MEENKISWKNMFMIFQYYYGSDCQQIHLSCREKFYKSSEGYNVLYASSISVTNSWPNLSLLSQTLIQLKHTCLIQVWFNNQMKRSQL